jgi:hypothetical protein
MRTHSRSAAAIFLFIVMCQGSLHAATNWVVTGWNNLGMHCLDSDFSVFSILPPYNTINAQIIASTNGYAWIVTDGSAYGVTYHAVADADNSINKTSIGKGNFWTYISPIFGVNPPPDTGLAVQWPTPFAMPGVANVPQAMGYESSGNWFVAYGIPIMAYDDVGKPNQYPMMRLTAKTSGGPALATADIVLPVSDEMDCRKCHLSNTFTNPADPRVAAKPAAGWFFTPNPGTDYRLNILRLHDERQAGKPQYVSALATRGFSASGLFNTVTLSNHPILCASCHLSEALPNSGLGGIRPLTAAVHGRHAGVVDPRNGMTLNSANNRVACYSCHPGTVTRCLRGAMGKAVAPDGSMEMQCQSCHGSISAVGATNRVGWLNEPTCQACHSGDAVSNSGQIRFTSVFGTNGQMRVPANRLFATASNSPAAGLSLYRYSRGGHRGLACAACHGSTHAEFPTAFRNDNVLSQNLQGHPGMLVECASCHGSSPATTNGGPHGLHPVGQVWQPRHKNASKSGSATCQNCHGTDYKGTVLSRMQNDRSIDGEKFGTRAYWRGQLVSCYDCHNGRSETGNAGPAAPTAANIGSTNAMGFPQNLALQGSGAAIWRIVSQPVGGTVGLSNNIATYYPGPGFAGTDTFTFAANSGFRDSNLATGRVVVVRVDSVGDGVPDWWRAHYFGGSGKTTNGQSAAAADPDGDGLNNQQEYLAGTDPLDRRSLVNIISIDASGANVDMVFLSSLGQRFQLEQRDNLRTGGWSILTTNIWGKTDETSFTDAGAVPPYRFYRVGVIPSR